MASFNDIRAKMNSKYGDSEEDKKKEQQKRQGKTASATSTSSFESIRSKMESKFNSTVSIDDDFIDAFISDAKRYMESAESDYKGITYKTKDSVYEARKKQADDLRSRSKTIRQYLETNKDKFDADSYNSFKEYLDEFDKVSGSNMYAFYERKERGFDESSKYSNMSSDEIKKAQKNSLMSDEDKNVIQELMLSNMPYNRKYAEQDGRDMGLYDEVEQKRKYISEKYGIKFTESSYENDKLLTDLMNGETIAYTTSDGRNVTWDRLYDNALKAEDLEFKHGTYSQNDDWAEKSKGIDNVADTESDYSIVYELSQTLVPYDWKTAEANGVDRATFDAVEKKRQYISQKYGVDLRSDIYNNVNTFNDLMAKLDEDDSQKDTFDYMSYLTDEEKSVLNYIYNTEGRTAALDWHNSRKNLYQDRYNNYLAVGMSDVGKESPFWGSVGSVALSLGSGMEYLTDIFDYMATGETQTNSLALASSSIRSGVAETVNWEIGNWDAFDFIYNTGMSMADSATSVALLGGFGGITLGLSAAAQATNDAMNRGMSQGQAFWNGLIAGTFECLFESISIGNFNALKEVASAHGKDIVWNIAKSMLVNASEETLTEVANIAYDSIFNGDFSQYETLVRQYVVSGMTEEEAKRKAALDLGGQIVESGASGALMGFGFGAAGSTGAIVNNTLGTAARDIDAGQAIMSADGGVDALKAFSGTDSKLSKQADKVTGETFTGKGLGKVVAGAKNLNNARNVGKLYRSVVGTTVSAQDQSSIAKSLESAGFSPKSAKNIADALAAKINGKQLTNFQKTTLETVDGNKKVEEVVNNLFNDSESSAGKRSADLALFNFGIKNGVGIAPVGATKAGGENSTTAKPIAESSYETSEEGKTILDGQEVKLNGLRKTEDGSVMVVTADNQTADPSEVTYPSKGHALVYENYAKIETTTKNPVIANMNVEDRSALAMAFDPDSGVDAKVQVLGLNQSYWYGFEGITMDENTLPKNSLVKSISQEQRDIAYELGRKAGEKAAKTQGAAIKAAYEKAVEKLGGKEAAAAVAEKNEGKVILENNIKESAMTEKQRASYELAKIVSKTVSTNIHVYHGMKEYGKYDTNTGEIWLNINGNFNGSSMMAFTLAHELVHMAKQWNPDEFDAFARYLVKQYGEKGYSIEWLVKKQMDNAKDNGYELDEHEAYEEVIADACMRMLLDGNALQKMAEYKAKNPGKWQKIIDAIKDFIARIRKVFEGAEPDAMESAIYNELDAAVKENLEDRFVKMVMGAGEHMSTIRNAFGKGTVVEVNANGEFTLAKGKVDGATKFLYNGYTWETGGRDTLSAALKAEGFSDADINAALTIMDGKHNLVKELGKQFSEQKRINKVTVTTDLKDGHSVLSALVSNGDYPVNIDLLMVCKKRKAYQRVINRLCETGMIKQATLDALAIAEINKILGKYGFETACLGCFVESRRLRIQEWANTIVKEWNAEVKKRNPDAKAFGFGKGEATLTQDEVMQLVGELEGHEKNDQGNLNLGQGSAVKRMGVLLDKVPSLRKTLSVEDLITPDGLSSLRKYDSNLFSMVKSRYGSNSPKFVQEFNPYNHELAEYGKVPSEYKSLREYLYAIGGARMQSFSDFIVENWFDYCQIVADLSARKLPMHTYTKEIALAKLFGMTGIKINMSLIPDIDRSLGKEFAGLTRNAKGELELIWADKDRFKKTGGKSYMQSINFADAIALQNDPRYSGNVGTIAVGVSDKHILMMLDDNRIRMIIPYHSSGMNPIFADLMGTSYYKDYTMFQNTTVKQLYNSKGDPVSMKLEKEQSNKLTSGFQFNAVLQELGDARAAAQAYKDWCADASKHTISIKGETYTAELTPKFDSFSWHDNYYKLLEDFNTYDCISEEAAPQGDVQQTYPEDFDKTLKAELTAQETHRQKQEETQAFDNAMDEIESYLSTHSKADTVFYAEQHGIKLAAKDKKLGAEDKKKLGDLRKGMKNSLPKVPAPTFYSHMARVVDGLKDGKYGATSLVSTLTNRGVKAEEIKWSGIETFLEGKKSVTKAELQEFIAGSMLQIEEEILDNKDRPYTEDQQKRLDEYEAKRDEVAKQLADEWKKITGEDFPIHNAGAGLESSLVNKIIDANKEHKDASFEGRLLKKLRKDLQGVIENNDDFGFDSWKDALRSIHRHRRDFIKSYEMSTNDKAIIVKYCNALNAYNELPNRISDEDADRLRAIARETDPWNRKIMEVKHEHNEYEAKYMTNWRQYSLEGGKNYREMLFRIPGSAYTNEAMMTHWKERKGVLAHARVQDMDTFIGKMLFIEEIQSDWHNAGHKDGYRDPGTDDKYTVAKKMEKFREEFFESPIAKAFEEKISSVGYEGAGVSMMLNYLLDETDYTLDVLSRKGVSFTDSEKSEIDKYVREYGEMSKQWESAPGDLTAPDAPFKDTYHEYVLKRLLREAAEQDYDSIGWTTAETQDERWQNNLPHKEGTGKSGFLVAYRNVYDRRMKKFLSDIGEKWGTTVGKTVLDNGTEVWSMAITDEMKDSVLYEGQPKYAMPKAQNQSYRKPAYDEWDVGDALEDALDHADQGEDNLIKVGNMPNFITDLIGIEGEFYIYRNHAYENMVSRKDAEKSHRPTIRGGKDIHFHNLGKERMTEAILSLENPIMTIADSQEYGNPQVVMILPVRGNNDSPLYAALSFYSDVKINGKFTRKPHIVLTISERGMRADGGFDGHLEVINKAVASGDVLSFDKEKMRDYLTVIANHTRVGDISSKSLADNIARFREFVNKFREKNHIDYKLPNSGGVSSRQLLADAFDELVQTPDERKLMDQYRNNIAKVEDVQERLRKLRGEISKLTKAKGDKAKIAEMSKTAKELAELIDKYDRKLLDLEASKPLKDVLARAKTAAYQEARERSEKDLKEYRQQVSERFDRGVEGRRKTEMRKKIRKTIRDLDKILNRGDKKRNVKEDMKDFVAEALASAEVLFTDNYTNEDIVRNGFGVELTEAETKYLEEARKYMDELAMLPAGGYDAWQARQESEEKLKSKLAYRMSKLKDAFYRERQRLNKAEVAEVLGNLADAYAKLETSEYAYVNGAYHEAVYEYLKMLQEDVGGAKVKDMTIGQLEELHKAYTMVLTTVQNANKMFAEDLKQSKEELANRVMMEVYKAGGEHGLWSKGQLTRNQASWNNTKPIYAAERVGSPTFVKLVNGLFKGQYGWATDMEEAKAFRQKVAEKYGFKNWDMEKTYKFTSSSGIEFELNLNQIMSLYAYAKREQAHEHLLKGGFVFGKNTEVVVTKNGIKHTYLNKSAKAHNISDEIMGDIVSKLSNEQKGFVDEMQDYLSTTMGNKGNEVSMRLYGVKLFMEKFYFPLRSAGQFKEKAKEAELKQQQGQISIVNSGFTNAVTPKASNPVVLDGFTDVWAGHVNEMSLYHSMVLPMEDFRRVYNYASPNMEGQESASVNSFIENAYGDAATGYFDQLYKELNGGAIVDPRENLSKQMIGKFKKSAVMLSNSVWVQQFSAIGRAYALIDPKYFIGAKVDKKKHAALWAEMKKYAPVAIIKEMGGFDTHTGLSAKDYLLAEEYGKGERVNGFIKDGQYRDEIMGLLPAKADELTWCAIWEAVKRETKAKNSKLDVKSEEFLKKAGERFSEIIEKTQVYDSVLARSANMRSKQALMQMLTAFMAEPTTTVNMVEDALRKGNKKYIARTLGAAAASIILNNALASVIYAMRDDDEDETFLEKYSQALSSGMLDDINPMTYYPILKDIWSLFQGFDVERTDMAIYSDIADSVKKFVTAIASYDSEMDDEEAHECFMGVHDSLLSLLDAGASAFGIPWKNIRRDLMSYYNTYKTFANGGSTTWNSFVDAVGGSLLDATPIVGLVVGESNTEKLYDAIIRGDTVYVNRLRDSYKDADAYSSAVRKALRENDPRIKEAALAQINGNPSERVRIARLIIADGFLQDDVVRAINAEINAMTPNEESAKKEKGFYTAEDFAKEIANGDQASANAAKSDIIQTAQKNGKSAEEAEEGFVSSAKSNMKKMFLEGKLSESKAVNALVTYCGEDEEDAQDIVGKWEFESEHGFSYSNRGDAYKSGEISAYELKTVLMEEGGMTSEEADQQIEAYDWEAQGYSNVTAAAIREYNEHCAASDVPKDVYLHIRSFANNTENDKDANGKTIYYSAMKKIMAEIGGQYGLTASQKTAIARSLGWAEKNISKYKTW